MWRCDTRRYRLVRDYQFLNIYWVARSERLRLDGLREFLKAWIEKSPKERGHYIRFKREGDWNSAHVDISLIPLLRKGVQPTRKRKRKRVKKDQTTGTM
jgi:hypothetical protein